MDEDELAVTADGLAALAAEVERLGADPLLVGPAIVELVERFGDALRAVEKADARKKRAEEDVARVEAREHAARTRIRELEAILKRAEDPKVIPWLAAWRAGADLAGRTDDREQTSGREERTWTRSSWGSWPSAWRPPSSRRRRGLTVSAAGAGAARRAAPSSAARRRRGRR